MARRQPSPQSVVGDTIPPARGPGGCQPGCQSSQRCGGMAQPARRPTLSPVRWRQSLQTLASLGTTCMVEVGPGGVLAALAKRGLPGVKTLAVATPDDIDVWCRSRRVRSRATRPVLSPGRTPLQFGTCSSRPYSWGLQLRSTLGGTPSGPPGDSRPRYRRDRRGSC